ncbi:MAG: SDR family NAD(P)-dependent oxidoreductase [Chitinophagales bacterium]|nr:SDR family NAD(P)-dependent oxidoreductase [Chitinophagales bacterium]
MDNSVSKQGEWALIAGASEGLGSAFAHELASRGFNVVLIARNQAKLDLVSASIKETYDVEVKVIQADLSRNQDLEVIKNACEALSVSMFVYNAAYSIINPFLSQDISDHKKTITVNCESLTDLVYHFANKMKIKRRGGIILMSSMSSLQGSPLIASYAASKAYIRILGESLWYEMKSLNVDVLVCCAGATSTPNFIKSKPEQQSKFAPPVMTPESVVKETISKLGTQPFLIPGRSNRIASFFMNLFMGNKEKVNVMGKTMYKMYPQNIED